MKFIEVTTKTTTAGAEMVSAIYDMFGAEGCVIEDKLDFSDNNIKGEWDYVDEKTISELPDYVLVKAYYGKDDSDKAEALRDKIANLTKFADFDLGSLEYEWNVLDDSDWKYEWKKYYKPFEVGESLLVRPYWESKGDSTRQEIILDPGMAFGNGTHETTFMCLEHVENYVKPNSFVYDVGCGTGILAVAAIKLGAKNAVAIDRDSVVVDVARHNVELNKLESKIETKVGDLLLGETIKADMIVANIIADVIINFSKSAYKMLKAGGIFISSGIIRDKAKETCGAIEAAGFQILGRKEFGEWHSFVAVKND